MVLMRQQLLCLLLLHYLTISSLVSFGSGFVLVKTLTIPPKTFAILVVQQARSQHSSNSRYSDTSFLIKTKSTDDDDDDDQKSETDAAVATTITTATSTQVNDGTATAPENNNIKDNFDGEGFAKYLLPYAVALIGSILATAAMFKFVLLDY